MDAVRGSICERGRMLGHVGSFHSGAIQMPGEEVGKTRGRRLRSEPRELFIDENVERKTAMPKPFDLPENVSCIRMDIENFTYL